MAMVPFVETDLIMGDEGQHLKRGAVNEAEETDDETRRLPVSKKKSFRKAGTELVQFDVQQQQSFDHSNQQQNVTAWALCYLAAIPGQPHRLSPLTVFP